MKRMDKAIGPGFFHVRLSRARRGKLPRGATYSHGTLDVHAKGKARKKRVGGTKKGRGITDHRI